MKAITVTIVAALCLVGCHADRNKETSSAGTSPTTSSTAPKADQSLEKSRDAMLDKKTDIDSQHWVSNPAAASTSTTPAPVSDKPAPSGTSSPPAASSTTRIN